MDQPYDARVGLGGMLLALHCVTSRLVRGHRPLTRGSALSLVVGSTCIRSDDFGRARIGSRARVTTGRATAGPWLLHPQSRSIDLQRACFTIPMGYAPLMRPRAVVAHLVVFCAAPALTANTCRIHLCTASPQPARSLKTFTQSIVARERCAVLSFVHVADAIDLVVQTGVPVVPLAAIEGSRASGRKRTPFFPHIRWLLSLLCTCTRRSQHPRFSARWAHLSSHASRQSRSRPITLPRHHRLFFHSFTCVDFKPAHTSSAFLASALESSPVRTGRSAALYARGKARSGDNTYIRRV
jgi:hypothetical protein